MKIYLILLLTILLKYQCLGQCEGIDDIFERMELQGIDTSEKLLYSYFFLNNTSKELKRIATALEKDEYRTVRIDNVEDKFLLQVEKIESHSRESLCKREKQLNEKAKLFDIDNFDGWDVGNIDPSKPLTNNEKFLLFIKELDNNKLFEIGSRLYELTIFDKALFVFDECIQKGINLDVSYFKLGICLIENENVEQGIGCLEKALKINPKYFKAAFNLGAMHYDTNNYQESIKNYKIAAKIDPSIEQTYYGIAASEYMLKNYSEALKYCKKTLSINPQNEAAIQLKELIDK